MDRSLPLRRAVTAIFLFSVVAYLVAPIFVAASTSVTEESFIQFPPDGFSLQWYEKFLNDPRWREAILNTLIVGFVCSLLATLIGTVVVLAVTSTIRRKDQSLEQAARTLGASPTKAFWHVVLPLLRPGIAGGAVLAFIISFDDVVMPIFLGGISAGTVPKAMLDSLYGVSDPTVMAVSASINAVGLVLLLLALLASRRQPV